MSAMTPEEKRARRREFYADPFRRALTLRTARRWRDKHKDELNARRREKYASDPVFRAAENARRVKHETAHPDAKKKAWKNWADKNREYLRQRDRERYATEAGREAVRRKQERRKQRRATDVEYRARQRQVNREGAKRRFDELQRDPAKWTAWRLQHWWLPRWRKLLDASPEEIRRYVIRARPDARREFVKWYSRQRLIDTASGLGRIPTPIDEIVPETSTKKK